MVEYTKLSITEPGSERSDRMQDWRQAIQIPTAYRWLIASETVQYLLWEFWLLVL